MKPGMCVLVWWKAGSSFSSYDDVSVVSVGASASVGAMERAAGSVANAAVTVTEAGRGVVEVGRRGVTPWERRGGSWDGSMVGRRGNGARPGRLRGGSGARGGTGGDKIHPLIIWCCAFSSFCWDLHLRLIPEVHCTHWAYKPFIISWPLIFYLGPKIGINLPLWGQQHSAAELCIVKVHIYLPDVPIVGGGKVLEPASDTALRSGSGRFMLGRLGSGGNPPGRGIRPKITQTTRTKRTICTSEKH